MPGKPVCNLSKLSKQALILFSLAGATAHAADKELLDILLANGAINQEQYDTLIERESITGEDIIDQPRQSVPMEVLDEERINKAVADRLEAQLPVLASHESSGFRLETRDGNWRTDLQWRAQTRFTTPYRSDPRQIAAFNAGDQHNFEARRLRMKIGGHGFQDWLRYYFEVDLLPSRDVDDSSAAASARVIDWRIDLAKWDWGSIRLGQWKVDLNRERVDSSGRQQFVERSIANRVFTMDRQIGIQLRGHLFQDTPADMRYFAGVFNGEGRGVNNADDNMMYMGRLQWNFLGRDLSFRQTDVEYTDLPTGSLALAGFTHTGSCTRWSSSGCGNLDGFDRPADAAPDQYDINQLVQEFAFKYRGFSAQQEYHRKRIRDRVSGLRSELTGGYMQAGYFFHHLLPAVPEALELAVRYAYVDEPNAVDLSLENNREELTIGANWFFAGHNNKLTLDFSWLDIDDSFLLREESDNRFRVQWDVSF
ncbi:MAG: OprO/OprP family phosphate-selective porin [Pseudomonadales bacterium]|nr:OprO/OprP family phosphate-selective porin [Pseudomonadales bacterium]